MGNEIEQILNGDSNLVAKLSKDGNIAQQELDELKRARYMIASMEAKNFFNVLASQIDEECAIIEEVFSDSLINLSKKVEVKKNIFEETDIQIGSQFDCTILPGRVDR